MVRAAAVVRRRMTIVDHEGDDGIRHFGAILIVDFLKVVHDLVE